MSEIYVIQKLISSVILSLLLSVLLAASEGHAAKEREDCVISWEMKEYVYGVIDRIENEEEVVILIEEMNDEIIVSIDEMPAGIGEGIWVTLKRGNDGYILINTNKRETMKNNRYVLLLYEGIRRGISSR